MMIFWVSVVSSELFWFFVQVHLMQDQALIHGRHV